MCLQNNGSIIGKGIKEHRWKVYNTWFMAYIINDAIQGSLKELDEDRKNIRDLQYRHHLMTVKVKG